jgi:hypothetical protein
MEAKTNGTADAWRQRIVGQQASGQSIRGWCRDNTQHEHAFYWWRSRLGLSPRSAKKRRRRRVGRLEFAEVVVGRAASGPPAVSGADPICLRLGSGRELVLPASMAMESIAKLVRAVEVQA